MIHYVDSVKEYRQIMDGEFIEYVKELKEKGVIRHIGMSTHNPDTARLAAESGIVEMILFSINPAFDMMPATDNLDNLFRERNTQRSWEGIAPERAELYRICEQRDVGITVMKGFAGGRLFDAARSPFGVALTPVQCIHYALTHPAVASILAGFDTPEQVRGSGSLRDGLGGGKRITPAFWPHAPRHAYSGPVHLLRPLQALPGRDRYCHGQQALRPGGHAAGGAVFREGTL